ncbi:MAG: PEGA domain-containing protein [Deltaproteobacteria bacterium]|nr:PEGA domain-containing protein [Deltaproteobacteria bacterium]
MESVPPGATVYIDGKKRGVTPLTLENKEKPGEHSLRWELKGFEPLEKKVVAAIGARTLVKHSLAPLAKETSPDEDAITDDPSTTKDPESEPDTKDNPTESQETIGGITPGATSVEDDAGGLPILTFSGVGVAASGAAIMSPAGMVYATLYLLRQNLCDPSLDGCQAKVEESEHQSHLDRVNHSTKTWKSTGPLS